MAVAEIAEALANPEANPLIAGNPWMAENFARCTAAYYDAEAAGLVASAEDVYKAAYKEDQDRERPLWTGREDIDPRAISNLATWTLGCAALLEEEARKPLVVSEGLAAKMKQGMVWHFTATGLTGVSREDAAIGDKLKQDVQENAAYTDAEYKQGWDHQRSLLAAQLAAKVALVNMGYADGRAPYDEIVNGAMPEFMRRAIAEYGPRVFTSGYPIETLNLHDVLLDAGTIIPKERAIILGTPLRNTVGQVETFKRALRAALPERHLGPTALIGHAPHLSRIVGVLGEEKPFEHGAPAPILVPVPTPDIGRVAMSQQEAKGAIYNLTMGLSGLPHQNRTVSQANLEAAA